jgi:carboxymethylenebutenolidase
LNEPAGAAYIGAMSDHLRAETITITGHDGDDIEAYLARPNEDDRRGGVVVIHHMPGYDRGTKEIVRRFAELGYDAICPNLYCREAPGASPDDAAAKARAEGGVPDHRLLGDVDGAARHLRSLPTSNGKVGVIGYCSGGRQSVLAGCNLALDAAVDCYGAFVVKQVPEEYSFLKARPIVDLAPQLSCPLLGLFGVDDANPAPDEVAEFAAALVEAGKEHDFHNYDGAGHAFFSVDRPAYRPEAAQDGWRKIEDFFGRHLSA